MTSETNGDPVHWTLVLASASKSSITGYTVIQAASMGDAVAMMRDHPHFKMPGATLDILEAVPMPGM